MRQESWDSLDPRIRRTRHLLHQALEKLLETKEFEKISIQDITDAATLNRATFYDHYPDKTALLECTVGSRFLDLVAERHVEFDGSCASGLKAIVLAVCEYLTRMHVPNDVRQLGPHTQSAIIAVILRFITEGLKQHPPRSGIALEMMAATASWAIYGGAKEWAQTPGRRAPEEIANTLVMLVSPMLQLSH